MIHMVTENEWNDSYNRVVDESIEFLRESTNCSTPADTGLVLDVLEHYFRTQKTKRCKETIRIAGVLLDAKHTIPEISWFDLYDTVLNIHKKYDFEGASTTGDTSSESITDIQNVVPDITVECAQADNLIQKLEKIVTEVEQEKQVLVESPIFEDGNAEVDSWEQFGHALGTTSGFEYGKVEIPNNAFRMQLIDVITDIREIDVTERDLEWIFRRIEDWMKLYVRAEATVARKNTSRDELYAFMRASETPAERYW